MTQKRLELYVMWNYCLIKIKQNKTKWSLQFFGDDAVFFYKID